MFADLQRPAGTIHLQAAGGKLVGDKSSLLCTNRSKVTSTGQLLNAWKCALFHDFYVEGFVTISQLVCGTGCHAIIITQATNNMRI